MGARENRGLKPCRIGGGESFERAARGRNSRKITQQLLIFTIEKELKGGSHEKGQEPGMQKMESGGGKIGFPFPTHLL